MRGKSTTAACLTGLMCLCILLLTGCGQSAAVSAITVPTISVSDKGAVTSYLVSDFDKDYYDITELSSMVSEEAAQFNSAHKTAEGKDSVIVESVETTQDGSAKAVVTMKFADLSAYEEYNETKLYYGTIAQAHEAGYDLDVELQSVKDSAAIGRKEIYEMSTRHILIVNEKVVVICSRKPLYISSGAVLNSDGSVDVTQTEGSAYIIFK